jgi:hypothetical protein
VVHKSALRVLGAAVGTVVATLLAGTFGAGDPWAVVVILAVLAVATWLRPISYAYWAGCVTAVLSLLYGYFGDNGASLLGTRLAEIVIGAALGIAASWLVFPVRTTDVLRRRTADALAALTDLLAAVRREPERLDAHRLRFDRSVDQLVLIAGPLKAHRRLVRLLPRTGAGPHQADVIDAVRRCRGPAHAVEPEPGTAGLVGAVAGNVVEIRRAIGGRPGTGYRRLPVPSARLTDSQVGAALLEIDTAMACLAEVFAPAR